LRHAFRRGGHNVPEADIRRRVVQGVQYMQELYRPIVDELLLFDSSGDEPRGIAWEKQGDLLITDQDTYNQIMRDVQS
jgi:predicted ABC-type ATPase